MIGALDKLLRDLLLAHVGGLTDPSQIRFQPPDDDWRTYVTNLNVGGNPANALNVYLLELRENRRLRSNERSRTVNAGIVTEEPAPTRVDCHYLITAWSPALLTDTVEPALDEHVLLYDVAAALVAHAPLNPSRIYAAGSADLALVNPRIRAVDLPTQVLPVEGFAKLPEFWGTMGASQRWKPYVHLVVTLPIALDSMVAGPMVTTSITDYGSRGALTSFETLIGIGGHVLDTSNPLPGGVPAPVEDAWVGLESAAGVPIGDRRTDALGRFVFERLRPDRYQLRWRAEGRPDPPPRVIDVPSPTGEYDLRFS